MRTIKIVLCLSLVLFSHPSQAADNSLWELYKSRFVSDGGRVIDRSQDNVSHSEGQGYGMLLAVEYGDRPAFDKIYAWTVYNLTKRSDNLFAWKWGKRVTGDWDVIDHNNATDGDVLIAFGLLKAFEKWKDGKYRKAALEILQDIKASLIIKRYGRVYLMPSYYGFADEEELVMNPSYQIFTAYRYFAREDDHDFWTTIYKDAMHLVTKSCFGRPCLPADWVYVEKNGIVMNHNKSPYFGYSAVRTIMHLSEDNPLLYKKGLEWLFKIYEKLGYIPKRVDIEREAFSTKRSFAGAYAIFALAADKMGKKALSEKLSKDARDILDKEKENYYSFSLYLLASSSGIFK